MYIVKKIIARFHEWGNEQQDQIQQKMKDPTVKVFETMETECGDTHYGSRCVTYAPDWVTKIHNQIM